MLYGYQNLIDVIHAHNTEARYWNRQEIDGPFSQASIDRIADAINATISINDPDAGFFSGEPDMEAAQRAIAAGEELERYVEGSTFTMPKIRQYKAGWALR